MLAFFSEVQDVILQLYKTLVKLNLEYRVHFWLSHYKKDVGGFEDSEEVNQKCCLA